MPKRLSVSELFERTNKRFCRPGFIRKRLHARGEPAIYLSKDKKSIITDHPDGTIAKEPFKRLVPLKSEQGRSTRGKDDRPKPGQGQSTSMKKRSKSIPAHSH